MFIYYEDDGDYEDDVIIFIIIIIILATDANKACIFLVVWLFIVLMWLFVLIRDDIIAVHVVLFEYIRPIVLHLAVDGIAHHHMTFSSFRWIF